MKFRLFLLIFIELYIFLSSSCLSLNLQPSPKVPMLPVYSRDLVFFYFPCRLDLCMSLLGSSLLSKVRLWCCPRKIQMPATFNSCQGKFKALCKSSLWEFPRSWDDLPHCNMYHMIGKKFEDLMIDFLDCGHVFGQSLSQVLNFSHLE